MGHEKQLLDLLTVFEVEHHREVLATPKRGTKGKSELRILECSINFDARGDCSSRKGKRVLSMF